MDPKDDSIVEFASAIGGLPFLYPKFESRLVLSLTAARRRQSWPEDDIALEAYLEPVRAKRIFDRCSRSTAPEPQSAPVSVAEEGRIHSALARLITMRSDWIDLFSIPVDYRKILDDRISMTSALIPQVVYLGAEAFGTDEMLQEIIVHEYAHIWLNFIAEIADLQTNDAAPKYMLPSGTKNKPLRGVLLAAHFAAAAHRYHCSLGRFPDRIDYLASYLRGCLALIVDDPDFTTMGQWVFSQLTAYRETSDSFHSTQR